jgi:hypothetical protein
MSPAREWASGELTLALDALADVQRIEADEFLTVAQVAAMLKLNQQTIHNWI